MSCNLSGLSNQLDDLQWLADNMNKSDSHAKAEKALATVKQHIIDEVRKIPLDVLSKSQMKIVIKTIKEVV